MIFDLARLGNEKPRGIFRSLAERPGKWRKFSHDSLRTLNRRPKALISVHYDSHHGGKEERKGESQLGLVCATRRRRRSPSERGKFICNMLRRITSDVFSSFASSQQERSASRCWTRIAFSLLFTASRWSGSFRSRCVAWKEKHSFS